VTRRSLVGMMGIVEIEKILEIIYKAVGKHNQRASAEQQLKQTPDTVLFGSEGMLDSLQFVSLILSIEEMVQEELEASVAVADDRALSRDPSPYLTLCSLAEYIRELMEEQEVG